MPEKPPRSLSTLASTTAPPTAPPAAGSLLRCGALLAAGTLGALPVIVALSLLGSAVARLGLAVEVGLVLIVALLLTRRRLVRAGPVTIVPSLPSAVGLLVGVPALVGEDVILGLRRLLPVHGRRATGSCPRPG